MIRQRTSSKPASTGPARGRAPLPASGPACALVLPGLALLMVLLTSCGGFRLGPDPMSPAGQEAWVQRTIESMSLREQVAGLVVVAVTAGYLHADDPQRRRIEHLVASQGVGGIAMWGGNPHDEALVINRLQGMAGVPLLVATDNEWGLGMRVGGSSHFPKAMAVGATNDTLYARLAGLVTGQESRAIGIHMGYGPVADVNNNPFNPIISVRSFGEDPGRVARMAAAWARGARRGGMLATAKHFPGHGDTSEDSHIDLPTITGDRARLEAVELLPFRHLIGEGIEAIMTAHLWVPAFDPDERLPASLSPRIIEGLLREQMGFEGLIITDALRMGAITRHYGAQEGVVRAFEAGNDLLLMPVDAERAIDALFEAVTSGRIEIARVRRSLERVLRAKASLGLHVRRQVSLEQVDRVVGDPAVEALARTIARASITVVRNQDDLLPLGIGRAPAPPDTGRWAVPGPPRAEGPFVSRYPGLSRQGRVVLLGLSSDPGSGTIGASFFAPLRRLFPGARSISLFPDMHGSQATAALAALEQADLVVTAIFSRVRDEKGHAAVVEPHAALLRYLSARGIPVVAVAFGPPYFLMQFPEVAVYMAAYDYTDLAQASAAEVVIGSVGSRGVLPVSIPEHYPVGWGLRVGPSR